MSTVKEKIQQNASLRFGLFAAPLFLAVQIALAYLAPAFAGLRLYNFVLLSLVGIVAGCAGWACGLVLSPIGSQASGAQKVLAGLTVFWSGIVIGHFQQISIAFSEKASTLSASSKIQLLFGLGLFLLAVCITFNTRFDNETRDGT
jgi:hypothetical protein